MILTLIYIANNIIISSRISLKKNAREHRRGNQKMENPEILRTLSTQDTERRQSKNTPLNAPKGQSQNGQYRKTGKIGYTRHKTKTKNKTKHTSL